MGRGLGVGWVPGERDGGEGGWDFFLYIEQPCSPSGAGNENLKLYFIFSIYTVALLFALYTPHTRCNGTLNTIISDVAA
jgi:hypothetical protein